MIKDYNPTSVKETELEDQHGNKGYNVFFEGETKPVFMMAKNAPTVGQIEYGQIVDTPKKSGDGTYRKFTRKQREEGSVPTQSSNPVAPATQGSNFDTSYGSNHDSMYRCNALNNAVATGEKDLDKLTQLANSFYAWLAGDAHKHPMVEQTATPEVKDDAPLPEYQGDDDIDLDDIPF